MRFCSITLLDQLGDFDERHEIGGKSFGLLPVKCVSGSLIHQEPRACDNRRLRLLIVSKNHSILTSPDTQGRSLDLVELPREIVLQGPCDRRFPD